MPVDLHEVDNVVHKQATRQQRGVACEATEVIEVAVDRLGHAWGKARGRALPHPDQTATHAVSQPHCTAVAAPCDAAHTLKRQTPPHCQSHRSPPPRDSTMLLPLHPRSPSALHPSCGGSQACRGSRPPQMSMLPPPGLMPLRRAFGPCAQGSQGRPGGGQGGGLWSHVWLQVWFEMRVLHATLVVGWARLETRHQVCTCDRI